MGSVRAVIDIGTNSVKLLVAEVEGQSVTPLLERSEQTRLGHGFYEDLRLRPEAIELTAQAVRGFKLEAEAFEPMCTQVFATSAARDAQNSGELLEAIRSIAGLEVNVISGAEEADWVFQGVTTDPALRGKLLLVMDLGGGSAEFIAGRDARRLFGKSYQLGVVRALESSTISDPPRAEEYQACLEKFRETVLRQIKSDLEEYLGAGPELVCTGGTATILARIHHEMADFDRARIEGTIITRANLEGMVKRLWSVSMAERRTMVGLPSKRADVILTGSLIYLAVMEVLGLETFRISTRGLRFAAAINCAL